MSRRRAELGRRRALAALVAALACGVAGVAQAANLAVTVVGPDGRPVPDAVVLVRPRGWAATEPIRFPWPMVVEQKDMQFRPYVLIAPVGAEVAFPNHDPYRHHVYSFSPARVFELKLYGHDETRTVRFDRPGVVALGCNIHDDMSAFIRVVDTPFAAKTGADGQAVIRNLPAGPASLAVWHPRIRGGADLVREITAPAGGALALTVTADVRSPPIRRGPY